MSPVPPPLATPGFPTPADGDSGVRPLTKRELRVINEANEQLEKAKRIKRYIWSVVGIVILTVAATASTLAFGQAAIDGGAAKAVAPVEKRVATTEADVAELKHEVASVKNSTIRSEAMLEMLVNNRGLTPPPKVAPDGGQ